MSSQEMDLDSPATPPPETSTFTPSTRIADLNEIDTLISTLLSSASSAISLLSGSSPPSASSSSLSSSQAAFQSAAQSYFSTLSSIEVRLRRQVYALEEAGLIPAGTERDSRRGRNLAIDDGGGTANRRGGGGPLDPSWLNARVNNGVEDRKKRELLEQGRKFVEGMSVKNQGDGEGDG